MERQRMPGAPSRDEWFLAVLHELVHPHGSEGTACVFVPAEDHELTDAEAGMCPALTPDLRAALTDALVDSGLRADEQREAARMLFPDLADHQHAVLLPMVANGRTAGVLVTAAAHPPLAKAGLNRVMELAGRGLGWVSAAEADSTALRESTVAHAQTDRELAETRLFLDLQERLVAARTTGEVVVALATWLEAPVVMQLPNLIVTDAAGPGARELGLAPERSAPEHEMANRQHASSWCGTLPATGRLPARVVAPIADSDGGTAGYLIAGVGKWGRDVTRRALTVSRGLIAYQLSVRQDIEASVATLRQRLLTDVLEDRPAEQLGTRAAKLGHDLTVDHIPVAVGLRIGSPSDLEKERLQRIVEHAAALASATGSTGLLGVVDDIVMGFLTEPLLAGPDALGKAIAADAHSAGLDVVVGLGPSCSTGTGMSQAAARARWAAEILRDPEVARDRCVAHIDDLGIYGLLFDHQRTGELHSFAVRWLGPLLDYDAKHRSELVATLRELFRQRSLTDAAAALHIHISTLKYRIGRIEEILGRSVEAWDNVFNLELALRVLAVTDPGALTEK